MSKWIRISNYHVRSVTIGPLERIRATDVKAKGIVCNKPVPNRENEEISTQI